MDYSCFNNVKQFSSSRLEIFSLNDLSLILEALVKYKNFNISDPTKAKLIKAMNNSIIQLTTLINDTPDADEFSLKGFTGKDISAMLAAIAWLDVDPKADPEIGELVNRLKKLRGNVNFKKGASITGTVLGTAAVVTGAALAIKAIYNKNVKNENELLNICKTEADKAGVPLVDFLKTMRENPNVPKNKLKLIDKVLEKLPGPDLNSIASMVANELKGAANA